MDGLTAKKPSIEDHDHKLDVSVGTSEKRSILRLFQTVIFGLLSAVAAIFTTMLSSSPGSRAFWLIICLFAFALALRGIVLFERSYKR